MASRNPSRIKIFLQRQVARARRISDFLVERHATKAFADVVREYDERMAASVLGKNASGVELNPSGNGSSQDRFWINVHTPRDLEYWIARLECTELELRMAVAITGTHVAEVERYLSHRGPLCP